MHKFITFLLTLTITVSASAGALADKTRAALDARFKGLTDVTHVDAKDVLRIKDVFNKIVKVAGVSGVKLVVVEDGQLSAQAFLGNVLVVNRLMATAKDEQLVFAIAHELSHIESKDTENILAVIEEVEPMLPGKNFHKAQAAIKAATHSAEYFADEYAAIVLKRMNLSVEVGAKVLTIAGDLEESLTHPATADRIKNMTLFY